MDQKLILLQSAGIFVMDLDDSVAEARYMGSITEGRVPAKMLGWLSANPNSSYLLFVDLPSEEVLIDDIPDLGHGDLRQYFRMLKQKHRQTHCLSKVDIVSTDDGKVVQKIGIADDTCKVFLQALATNGCLIKSIHSPLTLVGAIANRLKKSGVGRIYVLPIDEESYRLIACVDKKLVLNRGVQLKPPHRLDETIGDSLRESLAYLRRQAEAEWQQAIVCAFSKDLAGRLRDTFSSDSAVRIETVSVVDGAGIPNVQSSHTILMKLARRGFKVLSLGYQQDVKQNAFLRRRIRHAVAGISASLMVGATAIAAVSDKLVGEYESMSAEQLEVEAFIDNATLFLDDENDLPVEAVRQALATSKLAEIRSKVSPLPFLFSLSEHQSVHRSIQIHTVDWHRQDVLDIQSLQSLGQQNADDISLDAIYHATVVGAVYGELDDAMVSFDSFLASLRKANKNMSIRVTEAPFGLSEKSRTTDRDISGGGFSVEVIKSAGDQNGR